MPLLQKGFDVLRRLTDPKLQKSSIGIVTFSSVQKEYIERRLTAAIAEKRLDGVAYDRDEPLFVKNLENADDFLIKVFDWHTKNSLCAIACFFINIFIKAFIFISIFNIDCFASLNNVSS